MFQLAGRVDIHVQCDAEQFLSWIETGLTNLRATEIVRTATGLQFTVPPTLWRLTFDPLAYVDSGSLSLLQAEDGIAVEYHLDCTTFFTVGIAAAVAISLFLPVGLVFDHTLALVGLGTFAPLLSISYQRDRVPARFSRWLQILPGDYA